MSDRGACVVGGVLLDVRGVLLCRRRADRLSYPGVWDLPGGHLEPGEDDAAALARECREELDIEVVTSCGIARVEPAPGVCLSVRLVRRWRGEPRNAAPEEHGRIGWLSADQLAVLPVADRRYPPLLATVLGAAAQRAAVREGRSSRRITTRVGERRTTSVNPARS